MRIVLLWLLAPFGVKELKAPKPIECKAPKWMKTLYNHTKIPKYGTTKNTQRPDYRKIDTSDTDRDW